MTHYWVVRGRVTLKGRMSTKIDLVWAWQDWVKIRMVCVSICVQAQGKLVCIQYSNTQNILISTKHC